MKNKKAFTLIELLAVIVVLAIIALITTPIVTKTIESSKKGVAIESANNLIHSAELYFITTSPKYGKIDVLSDKLSYKGTKPELGEVEIDKEGKSRLYAYINGYCVTKEYSGEVYASKTNKDNCDWYGTDNYETKEGTTFTLNNQEVKNYLIYGNSYQKVRSGKNIAKLTSRSYSYGTVKTDTDELFRVKGDEGNDSIAYSAGEVRLTFDEMDTTNKQITVSFYMTRYDDGKWKDTKDFVSIVYFGTSESYIKNTYLIQDYTTSYPIGERCLFKYTFTPDYNMNRITLRLNNMDWGIELNTIQVEYGTEATTYEEYGVMPSPEYPSEVKSTGDLITSDNCSSYGNDACDNVGKYVIQVKNTRKNLFDKNNYTKNSKNILQFDISNLEIGKTYKFSSNIPIIWFKISDQDGGYNSVGARDTSGFKEYTFTMARDYHIDSSIKQYLYLGIDTNYFVDNIDDLNDYNFQIEEGTEATSYEEYVEPKITNIYLDEPLRKVGDYADYIDFGNKKVVRRNKEFILTGNEIYGFEVLNGRGRLSYANYWDVGIKQNVFFSNMLSSNSADWHVYNSSTAPRCFIELSSDFTSKDVALQFVKDKYLASNPIKIYGTLETAIEETIDLPNIEVLEGSSILSIKGEVGPSNIKLITSK